MAECGGKSLDVVNTIVRCEVDLMKMLRDLIAEERKSIDCLRVERYNAVEDLDRAKTSSMDVDCNHQELEYIKEKAKTLALIEKNIVRKQQYAAILSDIKDDRQRNLEKLSNHSCALVSDQMADLNVSS